MYEKFFLDSTEHFQWASIAAIISFLTFISSVVSIFLSNKQAKANREANTLVKERLDELNRLRNEITIATSEISLYISKNNNNVKNGLVKRNDNIINSLQLQFAKIIPLLYKKEKHVYNLSGLLNTNRLQLITLNKVKNANNLEIDKLKDALTEILIRTDLALNEYTNKEQEKIRKSL